jgi:dGTPase
LTAAWSAAVPRRTRAECALLKAVAVRYVMQRPGVRAVQDRERELLAQLVEALLARGPEALEPARAADWRAAAADDAGRLRAVVDSVAGLTDAGAVALHRRLLPGSSGAGPTAGTGP